MSDGHFIYHPFLEEFGRIWTFFFYKCCAIWSNLEEFGSNVGNLELIGAIWSHFKPIGANGTPMDQFGPLWTNLDPIGPFGSHFELFKPIWSHFGAIWNHLELFEAI